MEGAQDAIAVFGSQHHRLTTLCHEVQKRGRKMNLGDVGSFQNYLHTSSIQTQRRKLNFADV